MTLGRLLAYKANATFRAAMSDPWSRPLPSVTHSPEEEAFAHWLRADRIVRELRERSEFREVGTLVQLETELATLRDEVSALRTQISDLRELFLSTVTAQTRFPGLAEQWRKETKHLSASQQSAMHPAYQQIIGLGRAVIPLILLELRDKPERWFWALASISGENPVPEEERGNARAMRARWLDWGRMRGMIR